METESEQAPTKRPSPTPLEAAALRPNGPVAAVMLAAGVGTVVLGILTTLAEASESVHDFLEFSERVGPLSGKTILAAAAFLLSWAGLHLALRRRDLGWRPVTIALIALVAIGLVLTFPTFFQLFASD